MGGTSWTLPRGISGHVPAPQGRRLPARRHYGLRGQWPGAVCRGLGIPAAVTGVGGPSPPDPHGIPGRVPGAGHTRLRAGQGRWLHGRWPGAVRGDLDQARRARGFQRSPHRPRRLPALLRRALLPGLPRHAIGRLCRAGRDPVRGRVGERVVRLGPAERRRHADRHVHDHLQRPGTVAGHFATRPSGVRPCPRLGRQGRVDAAVGAAPDAGGQRQQTHHRRGGAAAGAARIVGAR